MADRFDRDKEGGNLMSNMTVHQYNTVHTGIVALLEAARQVAARNVNALMTASYWEIGRRIVEFEQGGDERAGYGEVLVERLSRDLTQRFGRGFGKANLWSMRAFYVAWPADRILQTASGESAGEPILQTVSAELPEAVISESLARKSPDLTTLAAGWKIFCWNWATTSPSSDARKGCGSVTAGSASIWCSSIAVYGAL